MKNLYIFHNGKQYLCFVSVAYVFARQFAVHSHCEIVRPSIVIIKLLFFFFAYFLLLLTEDVSYELATCLVVAQFGTVQQTKQSKEQHKTKMYNVHGTWYMVNGEWHEQSVSYSNLHTWFGFCLSCFSSSFFAAIHLKVETNPLMRFFHRISCFHFFYPFFNLFVLDSQILWPHPKEFILITFLFLRIIWQKNHD